MKRATYGIYSWMKGEEEKERKGTYEGVNVARRVLGFDRYIALSLPQITHFFKLL